MAVYGTFEYGSSVAYGGEAASSTVAAIDVLDANKIRVVFSGDVIVDEALLSPDSYLVEFSDNLGFTDVEVTRVSPAVPDVPSTSVQEDLVSTRWVELLTSYHTPGQSYRITVLNVRAVDGLVVAENPLETIARRTKVENVISNVTDHFDTRLGSVPRALLTAIGLEDDRIGGSLNEEIPVTEEVITVWSPTDIAELGGWWRGDTVVLGTGTQVTEMTELVNGVQNLEQATSLEQPTQVLTGGFNEQPYILFDGNDAVKRASFVPGTDANTLSFLLVIRIVNNVGNNVICQYQGAGAYSGFKEDSLDRIGLQDPNTSITSGVGVIPANTEMVLVGRWENSVINEMLVNFVSIVTSGGGVAPIVLSANLALGGIFASSGFGTNAQVADFMVFNKFLSDEDLANLQGYTLSRYNLG